MNKMCDFLNSSSVVQNECDYDKLRLENIRRNEEFMISIGIADTLQAVRDETETILGYFATLTEKRARTKKNPSENKVPSRRSKRLCSSGPTVLMDGTTGTTPNTSELNFHSLPSSPVDNIDYPDSIDTTRTWNNISGQVKL